MLPMLPARRESLMADSSSWVDVKVISTKPKVGIKHALCQAEFAKYEQYGQGPPERGTLHG